MLCHVCCVMCGPLSLSLQTPSVWMALPEGPMPSELNPDDLPDCLAGGPFLLSTSKHMRTDPHLNSAIVICPISPKH